MHKETWAGTFGRLSLHGSHLVRGHGHSYIHRWCILSLSKHLSPWHLWRLYLKDRRVTGNEWHWPILTRALSNWTTQGQLNTWACFHMPSCLLIPTWETWTWNSLCLRLCSVPFLPHPVVYTLNFMWSLPLACMSVWTSPLTIGKKYYTQCLELAPKVKY